MTRVMLWAIDRPWLALALVAAITLGLGAQIARVRVDTSTESFTVANDPGRRYLDGFKERFGGETRTIVLVKAADVFTPEVLGAVRRLSDALAELDGVAGVESLTTVRDFHGEGDSLSTDLLVAPGAAAAELPRIRARALGTRAFVGTLVSRDGRAAAILVHSRSRWSDAGFNRRFSAEVDRLIAGVASPGLELYQIGGPVSDATVGRFIFSDLATFLPISLGVLFVLLWGAFRSVQGVAVPMTTSALSLVWTLGLMGLIGLPINILTATVPSLLIVIGATEDIHLLTAYHHGLESGADRATALRRMAHEGALPIAVTTATTVAGFLSLVTTDIAMLIQFGWVSALGLAANFAVTIVTLPATLALWPVPRRHRPTAFEDQRVHGRIPPLMERLAAFNLAHRGHIALVALALVGLSVLGWSRLQVDTDAMTFFSERAVIRQRLSDFQASMGGPAAFAIAIESGRPGGLTEPALLRSVAALQAFVEAEPGVDKAVSVVDYLAKLHREMHGGDARLERVPDTREQVAQYLVLLEGKETDTLLDWDASTGVVRVRHHLTGSAALGSLIRRIEAAAPRLFPPGVAVRATGDAILIRNAADYMAINEVTSFGSTILLIALVHAWLFRSLRAGFLSLVPDLVPVLFTFGLMGALGIPLNPGTAMIVSVAIGIAVDDTVHHIVTYRRQLREHGDRRVAMVRTMRAQGRPIIYVSLALAGSFGVLGASHFVPIAHFGVLSAVVMLVAMASELTLTPILMYWTAAWHGSWSPFSRVRRSADGAR